MVARTGIPLAIRLSPATGNACTMRVTLGDAIPSIRCPSGQRRTRPAKRHADTGDAYRFCRDLLRQRHITPCIARKGIESSQRLGRHRWVVERTLAGLNRMRRLTIRSERRADIQQACLTLGCGLICWNSLA